ncbi:aspartyl/asparaginyl beta-hydroxylase domain-containing protein [Caulobacter endophyticus]|uniref:aspartyl/asparaginyl beta-hydroxylase domain-containing protein n=1 Tax=Caulobacter endophyticus TaxID=2172652 RepID=UPI00240EE140|nr:aspartyl/asparaginyl beta-hydroxylase domain-containing protein [Caulobacter endophyticus]MDG2531205.1 aspartyl/asparaginyl beta-hydroxylase domain-containing protein [Caulobacter endophyticus]
MGFPDRLKLPLAFDPIRLRADLEALTAGADWIAHFVTQNYDGDWSVIPLRCQAGASHPVMMIYSDPGATAFEDTPFLAPCPYFREVIAAFPFQATSVRLMKLAPGSVIKTHHDEDLDAGSLLVRFHVPVVTNPDVDFRLNGRRVAMEAGSAWYLKLTDPHSVANHGTEDRVHLVIDGYVNDWVRGLFDRVSPLPLRERVASQSEVG